jgi:uncharacterized membrane protein YqjE
MPTTYEDFVLLILEIIDLLLLAIFSFAFIYFVWKMVDCWILNAGDEQKRESGRKYAIAAVLMFALMVSAWGIVQMLKASFFG